MDTLFYYEPFSNCSNTDTLVARICCDSSSVYLCDTVTYILHIDFTDCDFTEPEKFCCLPEEESYTCNPLSNDTATIAIDFRGYQIFDYRIDSLNGPSNGTAVIIPSRDSIIYTPNIGFQGIDSVIYYSSYELRSMTDTFMLCQKQTIYFLVEDCIFACLLYTSPSPRDLSTSRMPSSA